MPLEVVEEPVVQEGSLQQRTRTALLLAPLALAAVTLLPTQALALVLWPVLLFAGWEWGRLAGICDDLSRRAYLVLLTLFFGGLAWMSQEPWAVWLLIPMVLWWAIAALYLARLRTVPLVEGRETWLLALGALVLAGPWLSILHLHGWDRGPTLVVALLLLIWLADSSAYLAGRRWGQRRLAPLLSPGKTWVGLYAGLLVATLSSLPLAWIFRLSPWQTAWLLVLAAATAAISVVGDLFESFLKRRRGMKDSGCLLPGHGGILDRIDSLLAAAPWFVLGLALMRKSL